MYKCQNGLYSVLCECNEAQYTVDRVETYLFLSRDRRRVLPGRTCDVQTRDAISRHASVEWDYGHS